MSFSVSISLTGLGSNTGPFNLLSNASGSFVVFMTGISKSLIASPAILTVLVPNNTTVIRVQSTGTCTTYIDLFVIGGGPISSTTTSTTITPSTTTTTTVIGPTTTTTTSGGPTTTTTTISGPTTTTTTLIPTTSTTSSTSTTSTTTITPPPSSTTSTTTTTTTIAPPTTSTTSTSSTTSTTTSTSTSTTITTTAEPTTTTTSSTSTTTTIVPECNCYSVQNLSGILAFAPIGLDCNFNNLPEVPPGQTLYVCSATTPGVPPAAPLIITLIGDCSTCPTTTTTTTVCTCVESVTVTVTSIGDITYNDCLGVLQTYAAEGTGTITITNVTNCIDRFSLAGTALYSIDSYGPCCIPPTTTTSSTTTSTSSTSTTTTSEPTSCVGYVLDSGGGSASIEWFDCSGSPLTQTFTGQLTICTDGSGYNVTAGSVSVVSSGPC